MSYHQDWLMRQIEAISAMLAYMLTGRKRQNEAVEEYLEARSDTNQLYQKLRLLVSQNLICEAENLLFASMEEADSEVPEAAVLFYGDINQLSDTQLKACDFSREEIMDGLKAVCDHYSLTFF